VVIAKVPATTDAVRTRFMMSSRTVLSGFLGRSYFAPVGPHRLPKNLPPRVSAAPVPARVSFPNRFNLLSHRQTTGLAKPRLQHQPGALLPSGRAIYGIDM
jgi:hypothetical protein